MHKRIHTCQKMVKKAPFCKFVASMCKITSRLSEKICSAGNNSGRYILPKSKTRFKFTVVNFALYALFTVNRYLLLAGKAGLGAFVQSLRRPWPNGWGFTDIDRGDARTANLRK